MISRLIWPVPSNPLRAIDNLLAYLLRPVPTRKRLLVPATLLFAAFPATAVSPDDRTPELVLSGALLWVVYTLILVVQLLRLELRRRSHPETRVSTTRWAIAAAFWMLPFLVVIPEIYNTIERKNQKRTMANARSIGRELEEYANAHGAYPNVNSIDEVVRIIGKDLPMNDAWGHRYRYVVRNVGKSGPGEYIIISTGKDGKAQVANPWGYSQGAITDFNDDIVYSTKGFLRYP